MHQVLNGLGKHVRARQAGEEDGRKEEEGLEAGTGGLRAGTELVLLPSEQPLSCPLHLPR